MSKYQNVESGSAPFRDRTRGPVTIYSVSNMRGGTTCGLNHTERMGIFKKLDNVAEIKIETVWKTMSRLYLKELRKLLADFNLKRHDIRISAGMGATHLCIHNINNGDITNVCDLRSHGFVIDQLQEIDQLLEGSWNWSAYLNGQSLTHF